ncbi:MAG TPA: RNA polymerase sigma factor [Vicinamibacterales bacterium]|nr:RNA polymerase sigma factor [Vicinamibacterales bacterium]
MTGEAAVALPEQRTDAAVDRLGALFDAHHQRLYRLARRLSRSAEDARDLVQETFLRAARAPGSVPEGLTQEEAWLVRVLVNLCRDQWRQAARRRLLAEGRDSMRVLPPASPESAVVARSVVWRALDALAPRRRAVVVMRELEGAPVNRIAVLLGVSEVTVRWHLSMGRRELARVIRDQEKKS